ncbi:hypothetical protein NE865_14388 [Phthorimaea operculella]|nr:hypothetical protein NE865_14388 [Phthorimaea operculella]
MHQKPIDALQNSGKQPGLEIWVLKTVKPSNRHSIFTAQQTEPEPDYEVFSVAPAKQGIFYSDDIYIVLKTDTDIAQKNIHFWSGKGYNESPPPWIDKFETLELGWKAHQHFEFQGYECELFESYFNNIQPAIRYKRGSHPDPYAEKVRGDTRFYKLERLDKAHYRVTEIPFDIALMTKEECFILDTDYNTRTYLSDRTNENERNKSIIVANRIREQDHEGNGAVEVVDLTTFASEADRQAYAKAAKELEEQEAPPPEIDYDLPDEDPASPNVLLNMLTLIGSDDVDTCYPPRFKYVPRPRKTPNKEEKKSIFVRTKDRVTTCFLRMLGRNVKDEIEYEIPALEEKFIKQLVPKPLKQENLNSRKCYILQGTKGQGIFIWVGNSCNVACNQELTECLRLELRRCDQVNERINTALEVEAATDAYTKKPDINDKKMPQWTHIIKVIEGNELVKFKRYFQNWQDKDV